jgi:hypothetical protein
MKLGSPVKASMRLAGEAMIGGARGGSGERSSSVILVVLGGSQTRQVRPIIEPKFDNRN